MSTDIPAALAELARRFQEASDSYARASGIVRDEDWYALKLAEELGELTQAWVRLTGRGRSQGASEYDLRDRLADEAADLLGHVLLFAARQELDLPRAIQRKWRFDPGAPGRDDATS